MSKHSNKWQKIIWREWRNCDDEEYVDHLFNLVADEPAGWETTATMVFLGAVYGAIAGMLAGLIATNWGMMNWDIWIWKEPEWKELSWTSAWAGVRMFVLSGVAIGAAVVLMVRLIFSRRLTWRAWLVMLSPQMFTNGLTESCIELVVGLVVLVAVVNKNISGLVDGLIAGQVAIELGRPGGTQLEQAAVEGRKIQEALTVAFTQKADELGQRLARRLAEVERLYVSNQRLLLLWFGEEQTREWQRSLQDALRLLAEEQYAVLKQALARVETELVAKSKVAEEQEDKHQKRFYLLNALQTVCREMKFREVSPPTHEREGDRGSRIFYTVDTLDKGKIAFALSLEGISSFSEIVDDHCFEEFDKLSEFLDKEFGVQTQFESEEGKTRPQLKHKEQKALPHSKGRFASRN